ncbi:MAG: HPP family protein [Deltaproteobacteria bacterium HGW-Deltaproteobacteria-6]|nr:MAG: HPP family protein [Deltaproteobacteria bacterium HGW-Deltaproteobacteria-6]
MKKSIKKIDTEFRQYWKHYVMQSLLATLSVFIVLYFLSLQHAVIIASIGSTAFIVFAMPDSITAQPRNVIGGQLVGLLCGFLFSLIPQPALIYSTVVCSFAVGAAIFIMVVIDMEHPPAAGTALGVAMTGISFDVFAAVSISIILLSLIHKFMKPYIRDLT